MRSIAHKKYSPPTSLIFGRSLMSPTGNGGSRVVSTAIPFSAAGNPATGDFRAFATANGGGADPSFGAGGGVTRLSAATTADESTAPSFGLLYPHPPLGICPATRRP